MTDLHISLGHNSSVVAVRNGQVLKGYEQERLDKLKSSSAFPAKAIAAATQEIGSVDRVYISHWFDRFDLTAMTNKYFFAQAIERDLPGASILGVTPEFTHHDAHARSVLRFYRGQLASKKFFGGVSIVVCDGFGNLGECLSVYDANDTVSTTGIRLRHRCYGYENSLGLMYQFMTSRLGLKENQDEYKLLGYESLLLEAVGISALEKIERVIVPMAEAHAIRMLDQGHPNEIITQGDALFDKARFTRAKTLWGNVFSLWAEMLGLSTILPEAGQQKELYRAYMARCVQTFIETCLTRVISALIPKSDDLLLAGGVFYNVKLNRTIMRARVNGRVCVNPLSGDQGASLGLGDKLVAIDGLRWGTRSLTPTIPRSIFPPGFKVISPSEWVAYATQAIEKDGYVNVVRGNMEYGPRALCNTTTFATPRKEIAERINALNARHEVMPMAPVMTRAAALHLLDQQDLARCIGSNKYMVITHGVQSICVTDTLRGAMHMEPDGTGYTMRPQIIDPDSLDEAEVEKLLQQTQNVLINTSFNYHGRPIVYDFDDALWTHEVQAHNAQTLGVPVPTTIVVYEGA